jgi:cell division protein FtsW
MRFSVRWWFEHQVFFLFASFLLLAIVIIPGVGHSVNGSIRWLRLGPVSLQVSEATKLFLLVYLSGYLVRHRDAFEETVLGWIKPLGLLLISGGMLLVELDFGSVVVILLSAFSLFFLAGLRLRYVLLLLGLLLSAFTVLILLAPYRLERLTAFLHPWENQFGSGYQLTQSLIAFGRGGWFGVGLGNGLQKLFYLPEAHTDFLFAVLAEELGLLGCCLVFFAYGLVMWRSLCVGRKAYCLGLYFHAYLAYGLGVCFGTQALVNFAVNMGWLPTKGLTLPLMSYGGSSLLVNCIVIALLLRISYEVTSGVYKQTLYRIPGASGGKITR